MGTVQLQVLSTEFPDSISYLFVEICCPGRQACLENTNKKSASSFARGFFNSKLWLFNLKVAARRPALLQIPLVILLRFPKRACCRNFCRNGLPEFPAGIQRCLRFLRNRFLLR